MDAIFKGIDGPSRLLAGAGGVVMTLMMFHLTADILAKYFLNQPIDGTFEIVSAYYMVAVVFLPLAFVSHGEGHIKVELFTRKMAMPRILRLEGAVGIVSFAYVALLAFGGVDEAIRKTKIRDVMETAVDVFAIWPSRWMVPLGMGLMAAYLLWRVVADFQAAAGRRPPVTEYHL